MDHPVTHASDEHAHVTFDDGLALECGTVLRPHTIAFRTYGTLNADKSNAILVCHALTGDQYVAENHPITGKPGWWTSVVGPGRWWTPTASSSSAPMCWAAAWAAPAP